MFHTFHNVKISALRTAVPANEIRLEDEIHFYGGSVKKITRLRATLGMDRRPRLPAGCNRVRPLCSCRPILA